MVGQNGCRMLVVAALTCTLASSARAQLEVELAATVGVYSPIGSFERANVHSMGLPRGPGDLGGAALGGELRLWVAPRIGLAFDGSTVSSSVGGGSTPEGYYPAAHARVSTGSAQLLYRVTGDGSRARVWLSAGAGLVQHGGQAYEQFDKPVNVAGVFGLGSAIRLTGALNAELGLTTMIYNLNMSSAAPAFDQGVSERGRQTDLLLRTGLSYTIR